MLTVATRKLHTKLLKDGCNTALPSKQANPFVICSQRNQPTFIAAWIRLTNAVSHLGVAAFAVSTTQSSCIRTVERIPSYLDGVLQSYKPWSTRELGGTKFPSKPQPQLSHRRRSIGPPYLLASGRSRFRILVHSSRILVSGAFRREWWCGWWKNVDAEASKDVWAEHCRSQWCLFGVTCCFSTFSFRKVWNWRLADPKFRDVEVFYRTLGQLQEVSCSVTILL